MSDHRDLNHTPKDLNHTPKDLNHLPKDLNHTPKGPKAKKAKLSEMGMEPMDQLDPVIIIFYSSDEDIKDTCALNGSTIATKTASGADIPARQVASLFKRWVSGVVLAHGHGARIATTGRDDTPVHGVFEGLSCGEADEAVAAFNSEVEWAAECRLNNTYAGSLMKVSGCESKMNQLFGVWGPLEPYHRTVIASTFGKYSCTVNQELVGPFKAFPWGPFMAFPKTECYRFHIS